LLSAAVRFDSDSSGLSLGQLGLDHDDVAHRAGLVQQRADPRHAGSRGSEPTIQVGDLTGHVGGLLGAGGDSTGAAELPHDLVQPGRRHAQGETRRLVHRLLAGHKAARPARDRAHPTGDLGYVVHGELQPGGTHHRAVRRAAERVRR
jgi:hypothetical protein